MFPGIDPEQMVKMQETTKHIEAEISLDYNQNTVKLILTSNEKQATELIPQLLSQFSNALAQQLSVLFGIKGTIIETGQKKE